MPRDPGETATGSRRWMREEADSPDCDADDEADADEVEADADADVDEDVETGCQDSACKSHHGNSNPDSPCHGCSYYYYESLQMMISYVSYC